MPTRKVNQKKGKIVMAITLNVPRAAPIIPPKPQRAKKPKPTVFDAAKATILDNLTLSIEEANGRYGSAERDAMPMEKPKRSKNWVVRSKVGEDVTELLQEQCEVTVRVGQTLWDCFPEDASVKESTRKYMVNADMLAPVLEELKSFIEGLDKNSDLGKSFHALAIAARTKRGTLKHNPETDLMEKK